MYLQNFQNPSLILPPTANHDLFEPGEANAQLSIRLLFESLFIFERLSRGYLPMTDFPAVHP
jgi:hypothetical protein